MRHKSLAFSYVVALTLLLACSCACVSQNGGDRAPAAVAGDAQLDAARAAALAEAEKIAERHRQTEADSVQRQKGWSNDVAEAPTLSTMPHYISVVMQDTVEPSSWQKDLIWSWTDQGAVEKSVADEIARLDLNYKSIMFAACITPGNLFGRTGRSCLMQNYACDAAKQGFHDRAWSIAVATQMHNGRGSAVQYATAAQVAGFLKDHLCPR